MAWPADPGERVVSCSSDVEQSVSVVCEMHFGGTRTYANQCISSCVFVIKEQDIVICEFCGLNTADDGG